MKWVQAESTVRPLEVDLESSLEYVLLHRNISEEEREGVLYYLYEEALVPKEDYENIVNITDEMQRQTERNSANIDYIAMEVGVDLDA